ncbi:hypothetical protein KFE25_004252 [Diacronema lutheri]|uniref:Secreted protein n=1 Tax=Diacronema lutheri TaxID=2081491 RepID=A0A8J6C8Z0_DIALT|nr:hypothetical protein KFE25_004252 [Diacronema lutheri]
MVHKSGSLLLVVAQLQRAQADGCTLMGFTAELRCSTCDALEGFLGPTSAHSVACKSCCSADDATAAQYASAVIDVCK